MSRKIACAVRSGTTLLEMLVVISIVGLVAALSLTAIQSARGSARRLTCANHLHQLGVAMHNHHDVYGQFPTSNFQQRLLPFLGQKALSEKLSSGAYFFGEITQVAESPYFHGGSVPVYGCPADPVVSIAPGRLISFQLNLGTSIYEMDGMVKKGGQVSSKDISDGLSTTYAVSEKLIYRGTQVIELPGSGPFIPDADQRVRRMATTDPYSGPNWRSDFADACSGSPTWFRGNQGSISTWIGLSSAWGYNHTLPPNNNSCFNGPGNLDELSLSATSLHGGGVNAMTADGAVRFVGGSIDRQVWWALGTRSSGDVANGGDF